MRKLLIIIMILSGGSLFAQDTSVTWMFNIVPANYEIEYDKKAIPAEFYRTIGISSLDDIANPNKRYQKGCVGNGHLPMKRLNWIAKDSNNHWVISISYGGIGTGTAFYFIDRESGKQNVNQLYFTAPDQEDLSLDMLIPELKARRFWRVR